MFNVRNKMKKQKDQLDRYQRKEINWSLRQKLTIMKIKCILFIIGISEL